VASYLIEGGPSKNFTRVKALMHGEPAIWHELVERQVGEALNELVLPATQRLFTEVEESHPGTPTILFGVGTGELLPLMADAGSSVVGIDWRVPLDEARRRVGPDRSVQGNLDPALCLAGWEVAAAETREVIARAGTAPGHIFNLGHGVLPETDPAILEKVVALVHAEGRAGVARA
jgi:uroporphyrinogen decarboxylase